MIRFCGTNSDTYLLSRTKHQNTGDANRNHHGRKRKQSRVEGEKVEWSDPCSHFNVKAFAYCAHKIISTTFWKHCLPSHQNALPNYTCTCPPRLCHSKRGPWQPATPYQWCKWITPAGAKAPKYLSQLHLTYCFPADTLCDREGLRMPPEGLGSLSLLVQ